MHTPNRDCTMPMLPPPTLLFWNMLVQNSARVQAGIMYGNTNTAEINFLHFRSDRVTNHATEPPITMPSTPLPMATISELKSGCQKLTRLQSFPENRSIKCVSVQEPTAMRVIFFSVPMWMVNMLESMVSIGSSDRAISTARNSTSSRFAGLEQKPRRR